MESPSSPEPERRPLCADAWMEAMDGPFHGHPVGYVAHHCRRELGHPESQPHQCGAGTCRREWPVLPREPSPLRWLQPEVRP